METQNIHKATRFLARTATLMVAMAAIILSSCRTDTKTNSTTTTAADTISAGKSSKRFEMVTVPPHLKEPRLRANYLVENYWNNFNFADTAYVNLPEVTEQALVDFINVLPHADKAKADDAIGKMLKKCIDNDPTGLLYAYFLAEYKKYLHDPNSPMRNEELYIPVVSYVVNDSVSDVATRERARFDLEMLLKNRLGTIAADLTFVKPNGQTGTLYNLQKTFTILYFYNPDCTACRETTEYLVNSPAVKQMLETGALDILAFYPDEELDAWKRHLPEMPTSWLNGRDRNQTVRNKLLYDLKAIPSLYLLDRDKRVLLKDADVRDVERLLIDYLMNAAAHDAPLR